MKFGIVRQREGPRFTYSQILTCFTSEMTIWIGLPEWSQFTMAESSIWTINVCGHPTCKLVIIWLLLLESHLLPFLYGPLWLQPYWIVFRSWDLYLIYRPLNLLFLSPTSLSTPTTLYFAGFPSTCLCRRAWLSLPLGVPAPPFLPQLGLAALLLASISPSQYSVQLTATSCLLIGL